MHRMLIALAVALALGGCASQGGGTSASTADGSKKTKRVCTTEERGTGSNSRMRVCRKVVVTESETY